MPTEPVDALRTRSDGPSQPAAGETLPARRTALHRAIDLLARINGAVATVLFAGLTAVVTLQVLNRFILHVPIIWSEELARFLFFWVVLLGAAMSVKNRRHFVIDVSTGRGRAGWLGRRNVRFLLDSIPQLCVLGFSLLLLVEGAGHTRIGLLRTATNSQVNMALVYAAIPVFAALSAIYSAGNLALDWLAFVQRRDTGSQPVHRAE